MKKCSICKSERELNNFYKKSSSKDGFRSECKYCSNIKSRSYKKNYYHRNKEKLDKEHIKIYLRKYKESNKESNKVYLKIYREDNKEKINLWRINYRNNKFISDPIYKLSHNIRSLISTYIKKMGYTKSERTESILGCSFDEFKKYIESQFQEGMSWENHGDWHLDHKIPVSWAETEEKVYELNHYTNFQPLWAKDNLSKGNKWSD